MSEDREMYIAPALREAIREEMERDEKVFLMGLVLRDPYGSAFGQTKGNFTVNGHIHTERLRKFVPEIYNIKLNYPAIGRGRIDTVQHFIYPAQDFNCIADHYQAIIIGQPIVCIRSEVNQGGSEDQEAAYQAGAPRYHTAGPPGSIESRRPEAISTPSRPSPASESKRPMRKNSGVYLILTVCVPGPSLIARKA